MKERVFLKVSQAMKRNVNQQFLATDWDSIFPKRPNNEVACHFLRTAPNDHIERLIKRLDRLVRGRQSDFNARVTELEG
jgi:hypothetical protein